jgi:hypothetical protein
MTALTATERGDLAERLLPIAAQLVCLVHGEGGPRDIQQLLARLTADDRDALPILVAALADPDRPLAAALRWLDFTEDGAPATPVRVLGTVRDLAAEAEQIPPRQDRVSAVVEDTAELARYGLGRDEIAARLGITWDAIATAHRRGDTHVPELAA